MGKGKKERAEIEWGVGVAVDVVGAASQGGKVGSQDDAGRPALAIVRKEPPFPPPFRALAPSDFQRVGGVLLLIAWGEGERPVVARQVEGVAFHVSSRGGARRRGHLARLALLFAPTRDPT